MTTEKHTFVMRSTTALAVYGCVGGLAAVFSLDSLSAERASWKAGAEAGGYIRPISV